MEKTLVTAVLQELSLSGWYSRNSRILPVDDLVGLVHFRYVLTNKKSRDAPLGSNILHTSQ